MSLVRTDLDDRGVFTITLDDPDRRNALSAALTRELVDAMDFVDSAGEVRIALLTNSGTTFCAGADMSERTTADRQTDSVDPLALFGRIATSPKPWVGRIAGHAIAGGTGLAAAMDISVALADANFGFTEVRLGLAPTLVSVVCLPKMKSGDARAAFLRGNRFDGREAARLGLVTTAVEASDIDAEVEAIIADLLLGGPTALAAAKDVLVRLPEMSAADGATWAAARSAELFASDEAAEGMKAFLEKRPAQWT